jgi:anti-sigma factor RsiW
MDCRKTQSMIHDFIDGTLSPADEKTFDRHVSGCRECARQIAAYRSIESNLGRMERAAAPEGFAEPVIRYLKAAGRIREPLPAGRAERVGEMIFWWIPERWKAPALASVVLVVVLSALSIVSGSFTGMVGKGTIAAKDVYIDAHKTLTEVRVLDEVPGDIGKDMKTAKTVVGAVYLLLAALGQTYMIPAMVLILAITVLTGWYFKTIRRRSNENASYLI